MPDLEAKKKAQSGKISMRKLPPAKDSATQLRKDDVGGTCRQ